MRSSSKQSPKKMALTMVMVFFSGVVVAWNFSARATPDNAPLPISPEAKPSNLETWARDVLTGVARERGVVEQQVVTQENIIFMLAWQNGEGGGTDGHCGTFNPLNTKYLASGVRGDPACKKKGESFATVNYASYSDGVAAAVYTITGKSKPYQTRVADGLTSSKSAEEMAHILATPEEFGGEQKCWACPGGAKYEKSVKGSVDKLKSNEESYRKIADKQLDGAEAATPAAKEQMPEPKPENDDSSPVTFNDDGTFAFPLKVNREDIEAGTINQDPAGRWCFGKKSTCHHDYPAADIGVSMGTPEVAITAGEIEAVDNNSEGDKNGWIRLRAGDICYTYAHLLPTSIVVEKSQQVKAGDLIGKVGRAEDAINRKSGQGTFPHLHIEKRECGGKKVDPQPELVALFERLPRRGQPAPPPPSTTTTTTAPPETDDKPENDPSIDGNQPTTSQQMTMPNCGGSPPAQMPQGKVKMKCSTEFEFEYEPSTTSPRDESAGPQEKCRVDQLSSLSDDAEDVGDEQVQDCADESTPTSPKDDPKSEDGGEKLDLCNLPQSMPREIPPGRGGLSIDQQDPAPDQEQGCDKPATLASDSHELFVEDDHTSPYEDEEASEVELVTSQSRGELPADESDVSFDPALASSPVAFASGGNEQIFILIVLAWAMLCGVLAILWLRRTRVAQPVVAIAAAPSTSLALAILPKPQKRWRDRHMMVKLLLVASWPLRLVAREASSVFSSRAKRLFAAVRQISYYGKDAGRQFSSGVVILARQAWPHISSATRTGGRLSWQLARMITAIIVHVAKSTISTRQRYAGRHRATRRSISARLRDARDYYFRGSDPWV